MASPSPRKDDVTCLYPLWVKERQRKALVDFRETDAALGRLRNVGSTYWLTVKAMRDARERVLAVWMAMPAELPGAETATDALPAETGVVNG